MPRVGRRASDVVLAFRFENAATPEPRDRHGEFSDKEPAPYGWNNTKSQPRNTLSLRISSKKALRKRHTGVCFREKDRNSRRVFRAKSSIDAFGRSLDSPRDFTSDLRVRRFTSFSGFVFTKEAVGRVFRTTRCGRRPTPKVFPKPRRNRRGDAWRTGRLSAASCDEGAGSSLISANVRECPPSTTRRPALKTSSMCARTGPCAPIYGVP